ncbi:MAG: 4Fe-4S binding protein [Bacillota bacterium]
MGIKGTFKKQMLKAFVVPKMNKVIKEERILFEKANSIKSIENSPNRFEILYEMINFDSDNAKLPGFPNTVPIIGNSILDIVTTLKSLDASHKDFKKKISEKDLEDLENYCITIGVGSIGYTRIPRGFIFKGYAVQYPNAIVFTMEMNKDVLDQTPSHKTGIMVHETYNKLGKISLKITEFLRNRGYNAHSGHPLMGQVLYPALAESAGLGYHGKHGLLITPEFGPRVRLAAVYTDIENFPVVTQNPHVWIEDFCNRCKLCVRKCPGKAIYVENIEYGEGLQKTIDSNRCFKVFSEQHGCSVCLKNCPFNQIGYDKCKKGVPAYNLLEE